MKSNYFPGLLRGEYSLPADKVPRDIHEANEEILDFDTLFVHFDLRVSAAKSFSCGGRSRGDGQ